ncbi:MAG: HAMP domain-containing sensor histidine kinase [Candidatus Cloacimonadales bacterium]
MKWQIRLIIVALILLLSINVFAHQDFAKKEMTVLILFSGTHESEVNRQFYHSFEAVLKPNNIKIVSDYIGDENSVYYRDEESFLNYYKLKYGNNHTFDLVLALNYEALTFSVDHAEEVFPDTDVIAIDLFDEDLFSPPSYLILDVIDTLHPKLEHLLIVSDKSKKGQMLKTKVKAEIDSLSILQAEAIYLDFSENEKINIQDYKFIAKENSAILLLSVYRDVNLIEKDYLSMINYLNSELDLPIYTPYDRVSNRSVVGGFFVDTNLIAKQLSIKTMMLLNGLPIEQIDVSDFSFYSLFFNKEAVEKFNLDISAYQNVTLINDNGKTNLFNQKVKVIVSYLTDLFTIVFFIVIIILVIKQRKSKKKILNLTKYIDVLYNRTRCYVFIVDAKTKVILDINQKVAKSNLADFIKIGESIVSDYFTEDINKLINNGIEGGFEVFNDLKFSHKGTTFPAIVILKSFADSKTDLLFVGFIDNSEQVNECLKLRKEVEDAKRKGVETANLFKNLIREIKNPINLIKGFNDILEQEKLSPDEDKKYREIIKGNTSQLLDIMNKIVIFSELHSNTKVLNNQEFSINSTIRGITQHFQKKIRNSGVDLKLVNYFSLKQGDDIIFNDRECFTFIFQEIIKNAIKFTESGFIECGYTHPHDGKIIFYIKDTGVGMSPTTQKVAINKANIWDSANVKAYSQGVGIGLAICKDLLSQMGGNIWLSSEEDVGTTVYFYLDYDMSFLASSPNLLSTKQINSLKTKAIAVIDEDLGNLKFIASAFKKNEIIVKTMFNFRLFIKQVDQEKAYNYIFIDATSGLEEFLDSAYYKINRDEMFLFIMTKAVIEESLRVKLTASSYSILYKPLKIDELNRSLVSSL